ncbi:MAG: Obg family GTPase CgtA [Candidatus Omnitrophica bacterium]|nr:Obg family GTPase CgtA [Candidatus Omnitrophota bacterium]
MFVDEAGVFIQAGSGGRGCKSFHHSRDVKKRRPDGGDGGRGGHIIIKADSGVHSLREFRYKRSIRAAVGGSGGSNNKAGRSGQDCVILVPPGTLIQDAENKLILKDLVKDGQEVVMARGGRGGRGNSKMPVPEEGKAGESFHLLLELKLIAEVGLVGYPNAGKSSLISCISKAKPKIAPYPFTTKAPVLGIVEYNDRLFKVADIPGLIEGAHQGTGLGDKFLRHIERTVILVFLIDMAGVDGRNPWDDFVSLREELGLYKPKLLKKPYLIAANKMDLAQSRKNLEVFSKKTKEIAVPISCKTGNNLDNLVENIYHIL